MKIKILLALAIILTALIYGLPNIILIRKLGADYNPLVISGNSPIARDEAFAYAQFVAYVNRGNIFLGDTYVKEYQNFPSPLSEKHSRHKF